MNPGNMPPPPADREQALAQVLVSLADTLVEDYDIVELLDRLIARLPRAPPGQCGRAALGRPTWPARVMASSSEEARVIELFQIQNNEGPCLDCVRTGNIVADGRPARPARALATRSSATALEAGFGSVAAVPMRLRETTIGALNLFNPDPAGVGTTTSVSLRRWPTSRPSGSCSSGLCTRAGLLAEQLQLR